MRTLAKRLILAAVLATGLAGSGLAQPAFPTQPITFIVGFAPGGPSDVVARLIAAPMGAYLGRPVVVENIPGAGGTIGKGRAAQARPDGHTLVLGGIASATLPTLYRRLPFDPIGSFEPVGLINEVPMVVVARRNFQAQNFAEFVAMARQDGERLNLGHSGLGSTGHLCGLLLQSVLGSRLTEVSYRGAALILNDLVSGTLDVTCDQTTNTAPHIRANSIRALAIATPARSPALPDLPTTVEGGLPEFTMTGWNMVFTRAGTPQPVMDRLNSALLHALRDEHVIRRFAELGTAPADPERVTIEASRAQWRGEAERWRGIIQAAGTFAD